MVTSEMSKADEIEAEADFLKLEVEYLTSSIDDLVNDGTGLEEIIEHADNVVGWINAIRDKAVEMQSKCCLCGDVLTRLNDNNADPVKPGGRCCGNCDKELVIPARCN